MVNIERIEPKEIDYSLNTKAINDAIQRHGNQRGGESDYPEGIWLTGPIELLVM